MHIIMATSEMTPFAKTGGLGDVLGALPYVLKKRGHDVSVFIPYYRTITPPMNEFIMDSKLQLGPDNVSYSVWAISRDRGVNVYGIQKEEYFDRSGLYGNAIRSYDDNAARFIFFSKAVLDVIQTTGMSGIIHCHDWPTALIPLLLHADAQRTQSPARKSVFTIHNLGYQGIFNRKHYELTNLPGNYFNVQGVEYFDAMNFMKAGILFATKVTTVSRQYAREIQTRLSGCGLDGVLRSRQSDLQGIVNGVDYSIWDPANDRLIAANFSPSKLTGKTECKKNLVQKANLKPGSSKPLFGMVSRFVHEKGLDLVIQIAESALSKGAQFVILGNGEQRYEEEFKILASKNPDQFALKIGFDEKFAHEIFAGSDFFLMPSLHEPCGLAQLYAMRYGTIPIVHAVGGLEDTVSEWKPGEKTGTGIKFHEPSATAFIQAIETAFELFNDKRMFATVRKNAMKVDCSWDKSATEYEHLYQELTK